MATATSLSLHGHGLPSPTAKTPARRVLSVRAMAPPNPNKGEAAAVESSPRRQVLAAGAAVAAAALVSRPTPAAFAAADGKFMPVIDRKAGYSFVYPFGWQSVSLVKVPLSEDMMVKRHTFIDERVLSFHDAVAIALRMLNSGETPEIVGSSFGVDGSTVSLLTQKFVKAMEGRAMHHINLLGSAQVEKIKRKFDKIHGIPNYCGVVHTTHIKFGSQNHENEENDGMLMHAVVDAEIRFTGISLRLQGTMNQSRYFDDAYVVESCVEGVRLNGRKLNVSSGVGSEVSEYIIGDVGYPLCPWLPTPYQLDNGLSFSDTKVEFNKRHSAATVVAPSPLTRLKDTWKCLEGEGWHPNNQLEMYWTVSTCCMLHNIVIDMEEEGVGMPSDREDNYIEQVQQVPDEDAIESGVHTMAAEEEQEAATVASGSGDENKVQEAHQ